MEIVVRAVESSTGWANIYFRFAGREDFPETGWTDNAAAIVSSLAWELSRFESGQASEAEVYFYDGPFGVVLRFDAKRFIVTIRADSDSNEDCVGGGLMEQMPLSELKIQCRAAYDEVVRAVDGVSLPENVRKMLSRADSWLSAVSAAPSGVEE